ncbi:hypothetical protein AALO_G00075640 [Alosa alosa]|uniref:Uncharacterized protein n=1 Tax=Alosa alosa TaxID=278164 RepID=A0AAV6GZC6_9TELE|nr:hypothetical protein AALO_G00075640 [Alosa alosa]
MQSVAYSYPAPKEAVFSKPDIPETSGRFLTDSPLKDSGRVSESSPVCCYVLCVSSAHDVIDVERCLFWILGKKEPARLDNRINKDAVSFRHLGRPRFPSHLCRSSGLLRHGRLSFEWCLGR